MNYIVLDMEWNQPPIGRKPSMVPFALASEIMEFGAVKLNDRFEPCEQYRAYVHSSFYPRVHPYVKKITGIDENTLRNAPFFPEAMKLFLDFCGEDFAFITWGPDDVPALCDNLLAHGLDTSCIPPTYNLQHIFNAQITKNDNQVGLSAACEMLGISRELPDHDALADAYHTALICGKLDMEQGLASYSRDTRPERNYSHPVRRKKAALYPKPLFEVTIGGFADRAEVMSDDEIKFITCPKCDAEMTYERYYSQERDKRMAMCTCPEHGAMLARVSMKKTASGIDATLKIFPVTPALETLFDRLTGRRNNRIKKDSQNQSEESPE